MPILAIDASSSACSVSVMVNDIFLSQQNTKIDRGHAAAIMPMVQKALLQSKILPKELKLIATTVGPGSFTGLRAGMAAAKGLAVAINVPLIGISCFDAVAQRADKNVLSPTPDLLIIALNSKREELYIECRDKTGNQVFLRQAISNNDFFHELRKIIKNDWILQLAGDGTSHLLKTLKFKLNVNFLKITAEDSEPVDASDVASCAAKKLKCFSTPPKEYTPGLMLDYLRSPDITIPLKQ
jgi:tRNA threonylcarbamoyl adenosine modification protein YeaZ